MGNPLKHTLPGEGRGGEKPPPPSQLFPLLPAASESSIQVQNSLRPFSPPRRWTLAWDSKGAPGCPCQSHLLGSKFSLRFLGSGTRGVGWVLACSQVLQGILRHVDLRNVQLRGLVFGRGGSVLVIEITTIYPVPAPRGALLTSLIFTTTTL